MVTTVPSGPLIGLKELIVGALTVTRPSAELSNLCKIFASICPSVGLPVKIQLVASTLTVVPFRRIYSARVLAKLVAPRTKPVPLVTFFSNIPVPVPVIMLPEASP